MTAEPNQTVAQLHEIPFSRASIGDEEIAAVVETLRSGWLTTGPRVQAFEAAFAAFAGVPFAVAVNSATAGLHLGLDALGVGPGDEVLVPTLTFTATAATVLHVGAHPRLVDCEPDTLNLSVEDASRKCGPRTKAIVPVHFAGHPCDLDKIHALADAQRLAVMEDAAHALPARYRGRVIGGLSPLTVFSFYATKNLTTGEGGMVTTADETLSERIRARRLHGMTKDAWKRYDATGSWRYDVSYPGFKYNLTDVAAALGLVQLRRLPELHARRQLLAARYHAALADVPGLDLPPCRPEVEHSWHLFVVRLRLAELTIDRDAVIAFLRAQGVGTSVHFIPLHEHSYYRDVLGYRCEEFPNTAAVSDRLLSLPLYPQMEVADVDRVAATLSDLLRRSRR